MNEPQLLTLDQAWARLWTHLDWADSFWVVFVFTDDPRVARALSDRVHEMMNGLGRPFLRLRPELGEDVRPALEQGQEQGVAWFDLVRHDIDPEAPRWREYWERSMMQLNERREWLRRRWEKGGVVFVTTLDRLTVVPTVAPDLWSIRSLVLSLAAIHVAGTTKTSRGASLGPPLRQRDFQLSDIWSDRFNLTDIEALDLTNQANVARLWGSVEMLHFEASEDRAQGNWHRALYSMERAIAICRILVRLHSERALGVLAESLVACSNILNELDRFEQAYTAAYEASEICSTLASEHGEDQSLLLGTALNNLALSAYGLGRKEEAISLLGKAIEVGLKDPAAGGALRIAISGANLSVFLDEVGRTKEAIETAQKTQQTFDAAFDSMSHVSRFHAHIYADNLENLARWLHANGRDDEAHDVIHKAITAREALNEKPDLALFESIKASLAALRKP
ncbi:MAG: tetratricopeptide repeat protein [Myxococcales bacterium]|nr:tetratricopeptide repeat protein [Myxococcales bacterium]